MTCGTAPNAKEQLAGARWQCCEVGTCCPRLWTHARTDVNGYPPQYRTPSTYLRNDVLSKRTIKKQAWTWTRTLQCIIMTYRPRPCAKPLPSSKCRLRGAARQPARHTHTPKPGGLHVPHRTAPYRTHPYCMRRPAPPRTSATLNEPEQMSLPDCCGSSTASSRAGGARPGPGPGPPRFFLPPPPPPAPKTFCQACGLGTTPPRRMLTASRSRSRCSPYLRYSSTAGAAAARGVGANTWMATTRRKCKACQECRCCCSCSTAAAKAWGGGGAGGKTHAWRRAATTCRAAPGVRDT